MLHQGCRGKYSMDHYCLLLSDFETEIESYLILKLSVLSLSSTRNIKFQKMFSYFLHWRQHLYCSHESKRLPQEKTWALCLARILLSGSCGECCTQSFGTTRRNAGLFHLACFWKFCRRKSENKLFLLLTVKGFRALNYEILWSLHNLWLDLTINIWDSLIEAIFSANSVWLKKIIQCVWLV